MAQSTPDLDKLIMLCSTHEILDLDFLNTLTLRCWPPAQGGMSVMKKLLEETVATVVASVQET